VQAAGVVEYCPDEHPVTFAGLPTAVESLPSCG